MTNVPRGPDRFGDPTTGAGGLKPLFAQAIGQLAVNQGPGAQVINQAAVKAAQNAQQANAPQADPTLASILTELQGIRANLVFAN